MSTKTVKDPLIDKTFKEYIQRIKAIRSLTSVLWKLEVQSEKPWGLNHSVDYVRIIAPRWPKGHPDAE